MFPGRGGGQDDRPVEDGRQTGDHEVHVIGGDDVRPVARHALVAEALGEAGRQGRVDVGHGDQPGPQRQVPVEVREVGQGGAVRAGHRPGADQRDPELGSGVRRGHVAAAGAGPATISAIDTRRPSRAEVRIASHRTAAW